MKYDRDLRILRAIFVGLIVLNAAIGTVSALARNWGDAFACVVWCGCLVVLRRSTRTQQHTRDLTADMIDKWREEWRAMTAETLAKTNDLVRELGPQAPAERPRSNLKDWLN